MRVVFVSDAHLDGPDDPNQRRFVRLVETLEADHLCLLGDIFQRWWTYGGRPFRQYAPVTDALRARGIPLSFVPGNHDFAAETWFREELGAVVGPRLRAIWDGVAVVMTHGDEVDDGLGYAALSLLLRGPLFAGVMRAAGRKGGYALLGRIAGHQVGREPNARLVERQLAFATVEVRGGAKLVVSGHTHALGIHQVQAGEGRDGTYVNLGGWVHDHRHLLLDGGRVSLVEAPI